MVSSSGRFRPVAGSRRPIALFVVLSFVPYAIMPAIGAEDDSLRWILGWLDGKASGNDRLGQALDEALAVREFGEAAYLAAVLDSYAGNEEGDLDRESQVLLRSLAGQVAGLCAPQLAPPEQASSTAHSARPASFGAGERVQAPTCDAPRLEAGEALVFSDASGTPPARGHSEQPQGP